MVIMYWLEHYMTFWLLYCVWFHTLVYVNCYLLGFELLMPEVSGDKPLSGDFTNGDPGNSGDGGWNYPFINSCSDFLIFLIVVSYHWRR